jgi:uncharacterized protein (DUF433 family)
MSVLPATVIVPLYTDPHGGIRVAGTRLLLDMIVIAFQSGATAEEIVHQFPSASLSDVYLIIAHYLTHTAEIDDYLSKRRGAAAELQREIEARFDPVEIRARLMARQNNKRSHQ